MDTVLVRARWPILNLAVGAETSLPRSALLDALVDRGYLELVAQPQPDVGAGSEPDGPAVDCPAAPGRWPRGGRSG